MRTDTSKNQEAWWTLPLSSIFALFGSDTASGLSSPAVETSRATFGANVIDEVKPASAMQLIIEGIREPMMIVLLSIGVLSLVFGKIGEAAVMVFVVVTYIAVEFINKYRTDRTMVKLRQLTALTTKVIRDGKTQEITTGEVVAGDILILTEGVRIPADARLIESYGLLVNEAPLTGESLPVEKNSHAILTEHTPLAERTNSVFSGTTVSSGEGKAIVCAVGVTSEFGKIARDVSIASKEKTVLQETMTRLAKVLVFFCASGQYSYSSGRLFTGTEFRGNDCYLARSDLFDDSGTTARYYYHGARTGIVPAGQN